jgi:hypothetical protein
MREAGYAPSVINTPQVLTKSKAWQEVFEVYLPDDKLFTKHGEALEATKWNDFSGEREEDHTTRLKAVELAYRVKGRLKEGINVQGNAIINVRLIRDERQRTT